MTGTNLLAPFVELLKLPPPQPIPHPDSMRLSFTDHDGTERSLVDNSPVAKAGRRK